MFLELEKEFVSLWVLCSIVRSATSIDMEQKEWELYVPMEGVWAGECGMYRVRVTPTPGAHPSAHPWDPRVSSREVPTLPYFFSTKKGEFSFIVI